MTVVDCNVVKRNAPSSLPPRLFVRNYHAVIRIHEFFLLPFLFLFLSTLFYSTDNENRTSERESTLAAVCHKAVLGDTCSSVNCTTTSVHMGENTDGKSFPPYCRNCAGSVAVTESIGELRMNERTNERTDVRGRELAFLQSANCETRAATNVLKVLYSLVESSTATKFCHKQ